MTTVNLTPAEVSFALAIATQRDACKRRRDSRISQRHTGFGVHFAGVVGELCFRKVYGGKVNQEVLPGGDKHQCDVILPDGRKVEVKTSLFSGAGVELKFEGRDELDSFEWVSLVQVTLPDLGIVYPVWSREEILPQLTEKDYGHGPRCVFRPR
jgi:hypothetical protein